MSVHLG